ncbi:MAG: hypothetical protein AAGU15_04665 [Anaerolineaceae bacterium]
MRVRIPFSSFVLLIGSFSLFLFITWLLEGNPDGTMGGLIITAGVVALIFVPWGIKLIIEDFRRYYNP